MEPRTARGIDDIYELTCVRKDTSRFQAVVSVAALRDAQKAIIGYLLIGTDNTPCRHAEEALSRASSGSPGSMFRPESLKVTSGPPGNPEISRDMQP